MRWNDSTFRVKSSERFQVANTSTNAASTAVSGVRSYFLASAWICRHRLLSTENARCTKYGMSTLVGVLRMGSAGEGGSTGRRSLSQYLRARSYIGPFLSRCRART